MPQITARVSDALARELDAAAKRLKRSRADIVRKALEYFLEDHEDLRQGLGALQDPDDPVLEWSEVRRELLGPDQA
jgi:RHH-type rel operon transcriptional repressor/antitoxin RelB